MLYGISFEANYVALVYKITVFLYTGYDVALRRKASYIMHEWLCFYSTDMVILKMHLSPLNVKHLLRQKMIKVLKALAV